MKSADIRAILEEVSEASQILSEIKEDWGDERPLDAQAWLAEHPELGARKSIVLDLAYEEFCQRLESGEPVDADSFARRFPTFQRSVRRLIAVHDFLEQNVGLVPTKPTEWPEPGQLFQGFSILAELGRGSFAKVFLAEESSLGNRLVAIKVSRDGAAEAEILGRLQHPNIVPVYSVRRDDETGLTVICMPYLGRTTLLDVLDRLFAADGAKPTKASSVLEALRAHAGHSTPAGSGAGPTDVKLRRGSFVDGAVHLGRQLADALSYAHCEGVCHSDLKPSNVLISPQGVPMLLDFNLAFARGGGGRQLGGTLPYMAPEHLRAMEMPFDKEHQAGGEPSDVFSLGVILYELLCGRLPFGPVSTKCSWDQMNTDLLERQRAGPFPLRQANQEVDAGLAELVESCLAFDPHQRPQSAKVLAAGLRRAISPKRKARRWARHHRRAVLCALASLVMICLGIVYHFATRAPYDVRLIEKGLDCYRQGQYDQAERCFSMAIEAAEDPAEAYYWRARARQKGQKAGWTLWAISDYEAVARLHPDAAPEIAACLAYCWALEGFYTDGVHYSNQAISLRFQSAEVYNNLGYSYLGVAKFELAQKALDQALGINGRLQAGLYNRALLELRRAGKEGRPVAATAAEDIEGAIRAGPPTANLYLDAARIYSRLAQDPSQRPERIVDCLRQALELGVDPAILAREFPSGPEDPILKEALADAKPMPDSSKPIHLVEPLREELFRRDQVK